MFTFLDFLGTPHLGSFLSATNNSEITTGHQNALFHARPSLHNLELITTLGNDAVNDSRRSIISKFYYTEIINNNQNFFHNRLY